MTKIDLSGPWKFAYSQVPPVQEHRRLIDLETAGLTTNPCTVPGNFELDLCANGIFDGDPLVGTNIVALRKYETYHVWYGRTFQCSRQSPDRAVLVFEGIDCIADIYLNGECIGSTDNMLIAHEFDVTDRILEANEILVHIKPVAEQAAKYPYPPSVYTQPHLVDSTYIRKAPHSYGWDIMPRALSSGLWRPVRLELRQPERLEWTYLANATLSKDLTKAELMLSYRTSTTRSETDTMEIVVAGRCGDSEISARKTLIFQAGHLSVSVQNPVLWWPRGRGDANLYDVTVSLLKNGVTIDTKSFKHGIRSAILNRTSTTDAQGAGEFCFIINHERVFVKGTNWVPMDAYHSRDVARIPAALALVEDIGCNMIRCWGGNVYENDLFFEMCDESGIMVWQDFAMACAMYPQDQEFCDRLAVEARSVIRRLRQHACLVVWAGDNECDESFMGSPMHMDPNKNVLTRKVLPEVLQDEDPFRPYLPSSPFIDHEVFAQGMSVAPEIHLWGVRHNYKDNYYKHTASHFVSEVGFHGCPSPESLEKFLSKDSLWPYTDNAEWILHSTSPIPGIDLFDYRVELMARQIVTLFGVVPDNLNDFSFANQVCQAEALKTIIEMFRSQKWRRTGVLWWNIIDGWPQFSDAVVDYYYGKKLAYDFIKRIQYPVCLAISEAKDEGLHLVASNDSRHNVSISYQVRDIASGDVISAGDTVAPADDSTPLDSIAGRSDEQGMYEIAWSCDGVDYTNHYLYGSGTQNVEAYRTWLLAIYNKE